MAIIVDKDGNVVTVEDQPEEAKSMFPNLQEGGISEEEAAAMIAAAGLAGLDFSKTRSIPDDITDLNKLVEPGIYKAEHGNTLLNNPFGNYYDYPLYIYVITLQNATHYTCMQYLIESNRTFTRAADGSSPITEVTGVWNFVTDSSILKYYIRTSGIAAASTGTATIKPAQNSANYFYLTTPDGSHWVSFIALYNPLIRSFIISKLHEDSEITIAVNENNRIVVTASQALIETYTPPLIYSVYSGDPA